MNYRILIVIVVLLFVFIGTACAPKNQTPIPARPVQPGAANPDEPVSISGDIPYTSPFFLNTLHQRFVLLEDQAGFYHRDREQVFDLAGQVIGPVEVNPDDTLNYFLSLPAIPQGTQLDVDNDQEKDAGVQVFAVAYWSNTWGDPFLEERDGTGWSTAYASMITDPENDNEITAGTLIVWAPDDQQKFPTGFGEDGLLFTEDDPVAPIPAGYNLVNLDQEPFKVYKEAQAQITLNEGDIAVNDYSEMDYADAFQALFEKASREYPFTQEKGIDWGALKEQFTARVEEARSPDDFYLILRDFTNKIPDGHVNLSFNRDYFVQEYSGGLGLVLAQTSDGRVIVTEVLAGMPGEGVGIKAGAELITWNGQPVSQAIMKVDPLFGPYSTEHTHRIEQVNYLTRMPPDTQIDVSFKNPGENQIEQTTLSAIVETDSLLRTFPGFQQDELTLPVEGFVLDDSRLGYVRVNTFSTDYQLLARLWEHYIQGLIDEEIPGLIIDLRANFGGAPNIAMDFAGYFHDDETELFQNLYYNENSGVFEPTERPTKLKPGPLHYEGAIAVLVSPNCISACEGFVYALQYGGRSTVVGHYPTAGAFGEVGRGQYELPDEISMQFPTGRSETLEGELIIEGTGITPDVVVPVSDESALGLTDTLLEAAIQTLLNQINR